MSHSFRLRNECLKRDSVTNGNIIDPGYGSGSNPQPENSLSLSPDQGSSESKPDQRGVLAVKLVAGRTEERLAAWDDQAAPWPSLAAAPGQTALSQ